MTHPKTCLVCEEWGRTQTPQSQNTAGISCTLLSYSLAAHDKNGTSAIDANSRFYWVVDSCPRCPPWTLKLPFLKNVDAWWQRPLMATLSYMNGVIAVTIIIITETTSIHKAWAVLGTVMPALYYQLFSLCNNPILWSSCFLFLCHRWFQYCW